jgi:3-oxoacyl-[acyl-carrier protein] reductase
MADLTNKIALVTGASRGIGRAAARSLAQEGARVLVHYGRGREEAESLVSEIRGAGGHAEAVDADLAAADGAHVLAEKVRKIVDGKLDILIFVSSLGARSAVVALAAYSATKGAVDTLVKHFAAALGPRGIRVNAVAPGVIDTEMSSFAHTESGRQLTMSIQALKRIATPEDICGVFAFLASDAARWVTGHTIAVDGGSKL